MKRQRWLLGILALVSLWISWSDPATAQAPNPIYVVEVGPLTQPAVGLVRRALAEAEAANAQALVIETGGGGSLRAAWPLAREIAAARVPVVTYIAPRAVRGGAVGTLLIGASHVAVMAPESSIGFAQPLVAVSSGLGEDTQALIVDDAVQQLRAWAQRSGRNAAWLEQAVRSGATIDAERARSLDPPLIDQVATSDELLPALQGRQATLADGSVRTLNTLGAPTQRVAPTALERLTQLIALPTVAFMLFVAGGIGLYLELATPGIGVPGVSGAVLILAALVGFVLGEVRPFAVVLLAAGLVVVGLEHVVMSHGGLTIAGLVLIVLGALLLVDPARSPGLGVSYLAIGGVALALGGAALAIVTLAVGVRRQRPTTGQDALIGQLAEVRQPINPEGMVFVNGALWAAWSDRGSFEPGEMVEIAGVDGLRLYVRGIDRV